MGKTSLWDFYSKVKGREGEERLSQEGRRRKENGNESGRGRSIWCEGQRRASLVSERGKGSERKVKGRDHQPQAHEAHLKVTKEKRKSMKEEKEERDNLGRVKFTVKKKRREDSLVEIFDSVDLQNERREMRKESESTTARWVQRERESLSERIERVSGQCFTSVLFVVL